MMNLKMWSIGLIIFVFVAGGSGGQPPKSDIQLDQCIREIKKENHTVIEMQEQKVRYYKFCFAFPPVCIMNTRDYNFFKIRQELSTIKHMDTCCEGNISHSDHLCHPVCNCEKGKCLGPVTCIADKDIQIVQHVDDASKHSVIFDKPQVYYGISRDSHLFANLSKHFLQLGKIVNTPMNETEKSLVDISQDSKLDTLDQLFLFVSSHNHIVQIDPVIIVVGVLFFYILFLVTIFIFISRCCVPKAVRQTVEDAHPSTDVIVNKKRVPPTETVCIPHDVANAEMTTLDSKLKNTKKDLAVIFQKLEDVIVGITYKYKMEEKKEFHIKEESTKRDPEVPYVY